MEKKNRRYKQKKTSDKGSGDQWAQDVTQVSRKPKKRLKSKEEKNKGSVFIAPSAKQRNREEWCHKAYLVSASGRQSNVRRWGTRFPGHWREDCEAACSTSS